MLVNWQGVRPGASGRLHARTRESLVGWQGSTFTSSAAIGECSQVDFPQGVRGVVCVLNVLGVLVVRTVRIGSGALRRRKKAMAKGWKRGFIKALAASGIVTWAAAVVKKSRSTVYEAKAKDPEFATAWDDAIEEAIDAIEMEARRRAMGYDEPVFYKGVECGKIRRYSDALLMFLLKAYRPEKYSERFRAEHTGSTTVHVKYADDVAMSRGWTVRALDDDSSDPAASTSSSAGA